MAIESILGIALAVWLGITLAQGGWEIWKLLFQIIALFVLVGALGMGLLALLGMIPAWGYLGILIVGGAIAIYDEIKKALWS